VNSIFDADDFPVVQDGETVQTNASVVKTYVKDGLSKSDVGLGNVDNTSDATKNSATVTLTNKTISGSSNTLSDIGNTSLTNSSITINGNAVSLGGSTTVTATASHALTLGTGLTGTSYNGSTAVTAAIDTSVVTTLTGTQTLTNKTLSGANNTLANIGNSSLVNSSITFGATAVSLGGTVSGFNGVSIGASSASTGAFTNLSYTGTLTGGTGVIAIGTNQIYKDASGNVGIGTASPTGRLSVNGISTFGSGFASADIGNTRPVYVRSSDNNSLISFQNSSTSGDGFMVGMAGSEARVQVTNSLPLTFATNNTERMRLDSSGNLGLGVTPSVAYGREFSFSADTSAGVGGLGTRPLAAGNNILYLANNAKNTGAFTDAYWTSSPASKYSQNQGAHAWFTAPSGTAGNTISWSGPSNGPSMTLTAAGDLLVGKTNTNLATTGIQIGSGGSGYFTTGVAGAALYLNKTGSNGDQIYFYNGTSLCGFVGSTSTTTSYNTSSDQRLKTNVAPAGSAVESLLNFPVDQFDWIASGEHQDFGAVAQKAIHFIPEMVHAPADEDEMWGIDWSKAVPRLIKTVQELHAEIESLKQRIN
jgi:hypothetical protein